VEECVSRLRVHQPLAIRQPSKTIKIIPGDDEEIISLFCKLASGFPIDE